MGIRYSIVQGSTTGYHVWYPIYITSYNIQSTSMTTYQSIYGASEDHFDFQTSRHSNLRLYFNYHTYAYGLPLLFYKSKWSTLTLPLINFLRNISFLDSRLSNFNMANPNQPENLLLESLNPNLNIGKTFISTQLAPSLRVLSFSASGRRVIQDKSIVFVYNLTLVLVLTRSMWESRHEIK